MWSIHTINSSIVKQREPLTDNINDQKQTSNQLPQLLLISQKQRKKLNLIIKIPLQNYQQITSQGNFKKKKKRKLSKKKW